MTREEIDTLVREALKEGTFSMHDLADAEGMCYGTLRAWAAGLRHPNADAIHKIADGLERHAQRLHKLAEQLHEMAEAA